ncbi:fibroblast growth factor 19 isoform 1-T1 [Spinachia spinachia]
MLLLVVTLSVANMFFAIGVICLPLTDQGLHTDDDWGQSVRVKHLYAARPGLHLLIGEDGRVQGSAQQSPYSLLEITAVDPGCVVIRGVATARFLCIEGDGRLYSSYAVSSHSFSGCSVLPLASDSPEDPRPAGFCTGASICSQWGHLQQRRLHLQRADPAGRLQHLRL